MARVGPQRHRKKKKLINNRIIKFTLTVLHNDELHKYLISFLISGKDPYILQHFVIARPSIIELNGSEIFSLFCTIHSVPQKRVIHNDL